MSDAPERVYVTHDGVATVEYVRANIHESEIAFLREGRDKLARSLKVVNDRTDELDDENARLREALEEIAHKTRNERTTGQQIHDIARRALEDIREQG